MSGLGKNKKVSQKVSAIFIQQAHKRVGFDNNRNSVFQMSDSDEDLDSYYRDRLVSRPKNPLAQARTYSD